ncbi:MAG TPA: hypothetical protein VG370_34345 [Chloroflexota bacterium]|nr:hypothetical protein [Chloroflexota bacterium]
MREFCLKQGYKESRTDHVHYTKVLRDGSTSGTMVSMGVDNQEVPRGMWTLVWRRQLRLQGEAEFDKGLRGEAVRYAIPLEPEPAVPLPSYLLRFLRDVLHLTAEEIATISREDAQDRLNAYYSGELREPS